MKRVILVIPAILGLLFITGSCMTQGQGQGQSLTQSESSPPPEQGQRQPLIQQRGMATQEMTDIGLTVAHASLPIGSKAKITNIANGKEIEVTISGRINPSPTRVIDLSPAAALALDIGFGGPVIINEIRASEPPPPPVGARRPLTQRGMATQENTDEGLTIRHPSLPAGSMAKVTNIANGKEIDVTISINRIAPSATRIVDLSPAAARALDIGFGGPVIINQIISPPPPPPPPLTQSGFPTQEIQGQPLIQIGMATQEMTDIGLTAAHPSLPIYSKAKVTNIATGKEIDVVITERIAPSATRVIDLSPDAASALDIGFGGPVIIKEPSPQQR